jgi:hypothetical protein
MDSQKLKQILCQHPKNKRLIYCQADREFYITGHICGLCLKIFDLKFETKKCAELPKISREAFDHINGE